MADDIGEGGVLKGGEGRLKGGDDIEIVGIINDDRTNVGRVHLGVVCLLELDDEIDINLGETDILLERQLLSLDDIREHYSGLEEWSKIIIDNKSQVFS